MKGQESILSYAHTNRCIKVLNSVSVSQPDGIRVSIIFSIQPHWFFLGNKPFFVATSSIISTNSLLTLTSLRISS